MFPDKAVDWPAANVATSGYRVGGNLRLHQLVLVLWAALAGQRLEDSFGPTACIDRQLQQQVDQRVDDNDEGQADLEVGEEGLNLEEGLEAGEGDRRGKEEPGREGGQADNGGQVEEVGVEGLAVGRAAAEDGGQD